MPMTLVAPWQITCLRGIFPAWFDHLGDIHLTRGVVAYARKEEGFVGFAFEAPKNLLKGWAKEGYSDVKTRRNVIDRFLNPSRVFDVGDGCLQSFSLDDFGVNPAVVAVLGRGVEYALKLTECGRTKCTVWLPYPSYLERNVEQDEVLIRSVSLCGMGDVVDSAGIDCDARFSVTGYARYLKNE